jgi:primosomal protein N' (replication factor Y) (superfamily II helicase)
MSASPLLRVALDTPVRRLFDYLPGDAGGAGRTVLAEPGTRVLVPFGRQRLVGVVVACVGESLLPREKLKPVLELLDREPVIDGPALRLLEWAADYYHHPLGQVIAAAMPKSLRLGAHARAVHECWQLTVDGAAAFTAGEPRKAKAQRRLLELVGDGARDTDELARQMPTWRDAARALVKRGWIASTEEFTPSDAEPPRPLEQAPVLAGEQSAAVDAIVSRLGSFAPFLLYGITGSGKTEVYLRAIERVLERGEGALVLVPEIGLTPQLIARFHERFATSLAVLHSALTDQERLAAWRRAYAGEARIVLGTRSAVFAPFRHLGLIIADEEHDSSYKQHEGGFRYSARDLAVVRAQQLAIPVVLGSATPALETLHNVATHRYTRLSLPRRAAQALPPRVALVDLRAHAVKAGLSTPVVQGIERHLAEAGQVLVFINRRGYAPSLACSACGWVAPCADCDARLTVHRGAQRLRCHHCGAEEPLPLRCPVCGFKVRAVGQGTERIEETLGQLFAQVPLARLDRDTVKVRGDMEAVMQRVASGEARILIGTQMITKGHHFPNVTLVVILNADQGLFSTDFRAAERLAQTIVQVAGRAGRGSKPGEVLLQTEFPEHPLLTSLLTEGYEGFARTALAERELAHWPPFSRLAALRSSAPNDRAALEFLREARAIASSREPPRLLGPVPATMAKRAGRWHAQLLIECADRALLQRFLGEWLPRVEQLKSARRVRWALDVDPLELY